jgi:hypothetical protein
MISTRWQTGNSHLRTTSFPAPTPAVVPETKLTPILERPIVMVGAALAAGIAIGLLVKWRLRR